MFDLEREIAGWRRSMSARLPYDREALDELESHLRDAVQQRTAAGAAPHEAWTAALAQLGVPDAIAAEYGKLPSRAVWRWLPAKVVLGAYAVFVAWLSWFVAARLVGGKGNALLEIHVFAITVGYTALFAAGALAAWSILSRALSGWSKRETEVLRTTMRYTTVVGLALTALGVVLGSIWAHDHLGRYWGWDSQEIGALLLSACMGLMLWLLTRARDERVDMLLGLAGSAMVATCWFGPKFASRGGLHDYGGMTAIQTGLMGLLFVEAALIGLVFVPPGRLRFWRGG